MVKSRSKLRERIREATAEAILDAAEAVFAKEGLHAAKVERIAQDAGVSVGTLYNHFDDRDALLCALIQERQDELREALDHELASAEGRSFREEVEAVLRTLFAQYEAHRPFFSILLQGELDKTAVRKTKTGGTRAAMLELRKRFEVLVQRGVKAGELEPHLADLAPTLLLGAARSVLVRAFFDGDVDPKSRVADVARFFLQGAGKRR